jgi:two-component system, OmpR family, osmolarity sensor histidine kinase EnvZ
LRLGSPPLFWRTFLLILLLIAASMAAWLPTVRVFEREPRARQIAQQVISIVNTTRSALVYSDPGRRRELLNDLAENEGIRVVPLEPGDQIEPLPDDALVNLVTRNVRAKLGPATHLASEVNGVPGVWVSFSIDDDAYWAFIDRDILTGSVGREWVAWAALAAIVSMLIAAAIARIVNRPLAELSRSAAELGAGRTPRILADLGPPEIRMVNRSFNRMVASLDQLERDRAMLLAGISHDLRTPLTRLRLELEMSDLPEAVRNGMIGDIDQLDSIVRQFLDYARPVTAGPTQAIDLSALALDALSRSRIDADPRCQVRQRIEPGVRVLGHPTDLARALDNMISNALRYGRNASGVLELQFEVRRDGSQAVVALIDSGPGIDPDQIERLLRPFERGDAARSGTGGAGLGLAIVDRIARTHQGQLELAPNTPTGLRAQLRIPAVGTLTQGG